MSSGLIRRVEPLLLKLSGRLPLCPWRSVFVPLNPRSTGVYPPKIQIEVTERDGDFVRLRFADTHDFWFPAATDISLGLWSEYLSVFWNHPENAHFYLHGGTTISTGDVVIDCGCCEGTFARQALERGASKVICLEPNIQMVDCLNRTFPKEIAEGRVVIVHAACGAFSGSAYFGSDPANPAGGHLGISAGQCVVPVETISGICQKLGLDGVNFIKMDIEGAEIQALEGAFDILRSSRPALAICTYHRGHDFAAIHPLLTAAGYRRIRPSGITDRENAKQWRPVLLHAVPSDE